MIKAVIRAYLINVFALWVTAQYVGGFQLAEGLKSLLLVGTGFTVLHLILRPILQIILGPINFLTLGLIGLAIDSGLLYLLTLYFPQISIISWNFPGLETAFFILPSLNLNVLGVTVVSAALINFLRGFLLSLVS